MSLAYPVVISTVVFISRYIFLEPGLPVRLGPKVLHFLHYTGPAVLTAIWFPIVFHRGGEIQLTLENPYFIAAILAITSKNVLLTTLLSMLVFSIIR